MHSASQDDIPYVDYGGRGDELVFLHANGYPPGCYATLLNSLASQHHVVAMQLRPLWSGSKPEALQSWHPLSDDLLAFLQQRRLGRVIAVGHSMGAIVALRATLAQPNAFAALILLDPVLVGKATILKRRLLRQMGLGGRLQSMVRVAQRRTRFFTDREAAFRLYRGREVFNHMSDDDLRIMIQGLTTPTDGGGYRLVYSPEWEAQIYSTSIWRDNDLWDGLAGLTLPTLVVRGAESDTFSEATGRLVVAANPGIQIRSVNEAGHLVPLEQPRAVAQIIGELIEEGRGAERLEPSAATVH